jgi:hypothetical protein
LPFFISCALTDSLNCARVVAQNNKKTAVKTRSFFRCLMLESLVGVIENLLWLTNSGKVAGNGRAFVLLGK